MGNSFRKENSTNQNVPKQHHLLFLKKVKKKRKTKRKEEGGEGGRRGRRPVLSAREAEESAQPVEVAPLIRPLVPERPRHAS